jgi:hypothetical protein
MGTSCPHTLYFDANVGFLFGINKGGNHVVCYYNNNIMKHFTHGFLFRVNKA